MAKIIEFKGTAQEGYALVEALKHNCTCEFKLGVRQGPECSAHSIMREQRILDGLVFMRRQAKCLLRGEFVFT